MKKFLVLLSILSLVLAFGSTSFAGKPVDADGDGYKSNVDCNDSDPAINPGALEVCTDGIDNNCDGFTDSADPTCGGGNPVDADADGYDSTVDCNDSDPLVNPGAIEVCGNDIDDNCDGVVDEGCGGSVCSDYNSQGSCNADPACEWVGGKKSGTCQDAPTGPVDADGDGYDATVDCNDSNPAINPGALEVCTDGIDNNCDGLIDSADPACGSGPVDADGDGYDETVDCNDLDPAVNPGAAEVCTDGIDNNCNGLADCLDGACAAEPTCGGGGTPHDSLVWADYPANCMSCHNAKFNEVADSTHYKWVGQTTEMANANGTLQGKLTNAVNSYCINILGDWKICGKCHVGRGQRPDAQGVGNENIDCLMCHNADYAGVRTRLADGSMAPPSTDPAVLNGYVRSISPPTRKNCLVCHANAGGGDAVKRGDISMATITNTSANFDVHMNTTTSDVKCQQCHVFTNHKTIGRGSDLRPTDDTARGSEVKCYTCHPGMETSTGHTAAGANRTDADRHVARVACQSCHIDEYAKVATEMHRDWRFHHDGSPADGVSGPGHPHVDKLANLTPEFKFWNRTSDNYLLGDAAVIDPATGFYPTSRPLGDINDGKLYPFKYKTADQPMISSDKKLLALDTLVYIGQTGDVVQAIESGLANMGYPTSTPYEWVTTDTYQLINHGVAPATTVSCAKCHGSLNLSTTSELDALGYALKGPKSQICSQCHREKNLKSDNSGMHNHINKGSGIGCYFCHSFERPERGLCSPCDPACVTEFVDTNPYPHACN